MHKLNTTIFSFLVLLLFGLNQSVLGQDKVWTGATDSSWHVASNWSPSGVPIAGQTVSIRNNTTPHPVITSNVTIQALTINEWYSNPPDELTIRNGATLTITDDLYLYGNGKLNIVDGHVELIATDGGQNKFNMNGNPIIDVTEGSFTAGTTSENLNVDINGTFYLGNGEFTVYGDLDVLTSQNFYTENGTVEINGNSTINGTFHGDDGTTDFNGSVNVRSGGEVTLDTGIINFNGITTVGNSGTTNFGSGTVTVNSDLDVGSGGYFNVQDADVIVTGDAEFTSNGNMTVDNGTITVGGNASLSSGGTIDLNSGSLNVGGDASFTSGGTVNAGSATLTLEGDFTVQNGSNFLPDSSTVVFSGDSTQTINTNSDLSFYNVVVDSGAVLNTDGSTENVIIIENNLTVNEGGGVEVVDDDKIDIQGEVNGDGADDINSPSPFVISAIATDFTTVQLTFNKAMVEGPAENIANYSIAEVGNASSTLSISSAVLNTGADSTIVILTVSTITEDVQYEVTMNPGGTMVSTDGGELSTNHRKRFTKFGPVTFYSRQNGNWSVNSTWSTVSHTGAAATKNPTNTPNSTVIVGDGHTVTIQSGITITNLDSVSVAASSKLLVGSGGTANLGTKTITGTGSFEVNTGKIIIGSSEGISSSGSTGNIQTTTRIFSSSGSYTYAGTVQQITGTGLPTQVNNFDIDNSENVRATDNIEVTGTLTLTVGSLIISSGNNLIANTKNILNGDLILERSITGNTGWRLLSSPLATTYDDLLDSTLTQGFTGAFYSTGTAPGDTLQPNVLFYDETYPGTDNQRWRAPASASTSIPETQGLYTFFFGDIDADPLYNDQFPLPLTLTVQGQENEGDGTKVDFGVSYTATADSGWNLVGNPYAASIDWDEVSSWTKTNIDNTIYVWDPNVNSFKAWNGTTGDLDSQGLIAPFQGFWVKANAESPVLEVNEDAKTFGGTYVGKQNSRQHDIPAISLTISNNSEEASTHFMFSEHAKIGKDASDAYRLVPPPGIGNFLDINTVADNGSRLSINNLPRYFGRTIEIPIYINAYRNGVSSNEPLTLSLDEMINIPQGWEITLVDNFVKTKFNVRGNFEYSFTHQGSSDDLAPNRSISGRPKITSQKSNDKPRFTLVIHPGEDAADLPSSFKLEQNYPNPFNPSTKIQFDIPVQSYTEVSVFNILGQRIETLVQDELTAGTHTFTWDATGYSSGIYLYRMVTGETILTKKMMLVK